MSPPSNISNSSGPSGLDPNHIGVILALELLGESSSSENKHSLNASTIASSQVSPLLASNGPWTTSTSTSDSAISRSISKSPSTSSSPTTPNLNFSTPDMRVTRAWAGKATVAWCEQQGRSIAASWMGKGMGTGIEQGYSWGLPQFTSGFPPTIPEGGERLSSAEFLAELKASDLEALWALESVETEPWSQRAGTQAGMEREALYQEYLHRGGVRMPF
ncbi:hypothetical protein LTR86_008426 [Recurvomyces mirabilis]|nr:hypothetical protein LTR86_008426 [Recurvomyces mirabilis]